MIEETGPVPRDEQASSRCGSVVGGVDVRGLDVPAVLAAAAERRRAADRAEADLLALAVHLVDLHPVQSWSEIATAVPDRSLRLAVDPATGAPRAGGHDLSGPGTPPVAERAVVELGAALDLSYGAALALVSDAVELCYRLPLLWQLVQSGRLQSWKARRVAQHTFCLPPSTVAYLDRHLAVTGARNRVPERLHAMVHDALLHTDPDTARGREEAALARRHVSFDYRDSTATAQLSATLDLLDALDLDRTLADLAATMHRLGDTDPLDVRRAHALGLLAHPQRILDLYAGTRAATLDPAPQEALPKQAPCQRWNATSATVYLHVSADDLPNPPAAGGTVERLGHATLGLLHDWLQRTDRVTIRPVLDTGRSDAVDQHDPPSWMRELVILRDGHCVFPGCSIDARTCDQDHIDPYVPLDEGGPPGQTTPTNLACLCRRHHRLKTFTAWTYRRAGPGLYEWTDPYGTSYLATPDRKH